jgi:glycosyltransferase involved in cell wall biosynthesis
MRLLFVTDHVHLPQRVGGTKSSTHELCVSLGERGHEVALLCRLEGRGLVGLLHRVCRHLPAGGRPFADRLLGYRAFRSYVVDDPAVAAAAEALRPDLVVVQAERPVPLARAAMAAGHAVLVYLRDVETDKLGGAPAGPEAWPRLAYVANSVFTARRYAEAFGLRAEVVPPIVRPERYRAATAPGGRRFVTFVNPVEEKGAELAFALAEARRDLQFLFVAGWPVAPETDRRRRERARALGNITWQESVQDMRPVYARTRLLLAPSQWEEAWGRVASEAQLNGIPVLASRRGGLPEAVGGGGVLLPHDAPVAEWAAALSDMLDDPARYAAFSAAAAAHAARPGFRPEALLTTLEAVMRRQVAAWAEAAPMPATAA